MEGREKEGLLALGKKTEYRQDYAPEVLESFTCPSILTVLLPASGASREYRITVLSFIL